MLNIYRIKLYYKYIVLIEQQVKSCQIMFLIRTVYYCSNLTKGLPSPFIILNGKTGPIITSTL